MTERQRKFFYFPAWNRCARANDWVMVGGRLLADLGKQRAEFIDWPGHQHPIWSAGPQVLDYAEQLARQEHRAVTAEDLRHGCNLVATAGRKSSSDDLDNKDMNRVGALFRLLAEPDDMDAVMGWLHPEIAERRGLVNFIRKQAPEATLSAIAKNACGTIFWQELDEQRLRWLLKQVKGRKTAFRAPVTAQTTKTEEPF